MNKSEALEYRRSGQPGVMSMSLSKPISTQRELALVYSPGVAESVLEISKDHSNSYQYTNKANTIAIVSNGTAILGLGSLGAAACKPVIEGKAALFKLGADVDAVNIALDTTSVDEFVKCVALFAENFGAICLEDIKAPECFLIEEKLQKLVDVPVFHDDQHGTAIVTAAGLMNALELTGRSVSETRLVSIGAGAAAIATLDLLTAMGFKKSNITMCDINGVLYEGREENSNRWKENYARKTDLRKHSEVLKGADVVIGLSVKGAIDEEMIRSMADNPIIFALATPEPEISPEQIEQISPGAIIATGRSDYPNQVNNYICFPSLFRGALDTQAKSINMEMKIAAAKAIANVAKNDKNYGVNYILPWPFHPDLLRTISSSVAEAAQKTETARVAITDLHTYREKLSKAVPILQQASNYKEQPSVEDTPNNLDVEKRAFSLELEVDALGHVKLSRNLNGKIPSESPEIKSRVNQAISDLKHFRDELQKSNIIDEGAKNELDGATKMVEASLSNRTYDKGRLSWVRELLLQISAGAAGTVLGAAALAAAEALAGLLPFV